LNTSGWKGLPRPRLLADVIVPGSLVFQSKNLVETFSWLRAL